MTQSIAIILARGGSKGVPCKNIKLLAGKPLIAYSILDAKEAKLINEVYVSTDDNEIADVSMQYGAKVIMRPPQLANDTASSESALIHAIEYLEANNIFSDFIVFLQCTSPIRTGEDIDKAIMQIYYEEADSLVSVSPNHKFLWNADGKSINYDYRNRPRRQDMSAQFVENGSIYIFKPWIIKTLNNRLGGKISLFIMNEEAALDIDTSTDFIIAEALI